MARADPSQLPGKLSPDAHACRERLPGTHTVTYSPGNGRQSAMQRCLKSYISEEAESSESAACYPLSAQRNVKLRQVSAPCK